MPNLTQLGSNLFLGSTYSCVVHTDDNGQTWVAHHTDKTRNYKTDWSAQKVAEVLSDGKTAEEKLREQRSAGTADGRRQAAYAHNKLPWWKRMRKKEI